MEIKDMYKKLIKHRVDLGFSLIIGILLGVILYFLPSKYVASGSFFVERKISTESGVFTYEGYYGQQTAITYANSILSLMESVDIKKIVLETNKIPLTPKNMNMLDRIITVKKVGPQVISLSVKAWTYEEAKRLWNSVSNITVASAYEINKNGDENLSISPLTPQPLVNLPYKSSYLYATVGALISFTLVSFFICLKEYFKSN
jgi:capsular polysaccharide biosynthesis protein